VWLDRPDAFSSRYPHHVPHRRAESRAWAALPLIINDRRIGVFAMSFDQAGEFAPEDRLFIQLLAQECAQALERARLHDMEMRARVRAEFAERRLTFLSEASARLVASLDYLATLANLAHFSVPELADWCIIHLVDDDGVPRTVAIAHSDPTLSALQRSLEENYPSRLESSAPFARVLQTGQPVHIPEVTDAELRTAAHDDEHFEALRSLGIRSQISTPISVEDRIIGVFTLATAESGRRFTDADIRLSLELGRRAGYAVENARLYQVVQHASDAKSDFLAVMSHELRTPLNAIIGYSDLLLLGVPESVPERAQHQVKRILSASTSLLHLVEEVLSFSRIEAGKEDIRISPVDVAQVMRDCVAMIEPLAQEKRLAIEFDVPADPVKIVSDERKVRQVLTNLLSNAVKFTELGGIYASLSTSETEVCLSIRDTGIGIPGQYIERIFDPFWQVEQSATRRFGGTGLGLGVARKLARLLDGRLEVKSAVGDGSIFTLVLPIMTSLKPKGT